MSLNHQPKADQLSPLSANQKAIWLEQKLYPESPSYIVGGYFTIDGGVDEAIFVQALTILVNETDSLRTRIREVDQQPYQAFAHVPDYEMECMDFSHEAEPFEAAQAWMKSDFGKPFILNDSPLFNFKLIKLSDQYYVQFSKFHHIIIDGFGIALFGNRIAEIYASLLEGEEVSTKHVYAYKDFIEFDAEYHESDRFDKDKAYWVDKFKTLPEALVLDLAHPAIPEMPPKETVRINRSIYDKVALACTEHRVSVFHYFLGVLHLYFSRFYQKNDWVIGLPILNRSSFKHKRTIGMFTGNIPLRIDGSQADDLLDLMRLFKTELGESYRHQKFPFDELTRALNLIGKGRQRLFDITFSYEKHTYGMTFEGAPTRTVPLSGGNGLDPLAVFVREYENDDWVDIEFSYSKSYFKQAEIARMLGHFKFLIEELSGDLNRKLDEVVILPDSERQQLLEGFNQTQTSYPHNQTIVQQFEAQANQTPEAIATVFEGRELSYQQLNEKANEVAHYLIENHKVETDSPIGILLERSEWMLVSMLGVMKAGAAYLPIDPDYPEERVRYVIEDSGTEIVLSEQKFLSQKEEESAIAFIDVRGLSRDKNSNPKVRAKARNLAYVIYTSGSTGRPKGVMVEHGNVVNFFAGMDQKVPRQEKDNTLLAVTTISFDISVLELLWSLTRGFKVVISPSKAQVPVAEQKARSSKKVDFSLFYFASEVDVNDKYRLLIEGAKFADTHGFSAIWTPERHFHEFGGIYPNPAITGAAIATITENIQIRSGSCVLPLHNPIRVVEEWSVVDNLSNGRVGLSFASGWVNNDFLAFAPGGFKDRKKTMDEGISKVKALWRGEPVTLHNPDGPDAEVNLYPQPVQPELPVWVTAAGSPETFRMAGRSGANLLTHLLGQTVDELAEKIDIYREAWNEAGHEGEGHVTLMIHTYIDEDMERVRQRVRVPFRNYIKSSTGLMRMVAQSMGQDPDSLKGPNLEALLDHAYNRYFDTAALFGTPDSCLDMVNKLSLAGVDELGCLVDFGLEASATIEGFDHLDRLKENYRQQLKETAEEITSTQLIKLHEVSHMQCTPSTMKMMLMESNAVANLEPLSYLMLGGEPLPKHLADSIHEQLELKLLNMYGPTETTIWSSVSEVLPGEEINIGKPIANTQFYILDKQMMPVPIGAIGDVYIGGDGVTRGYHKRPELTAERFLADPFKKGGKIYKTGDQGRWLEDGSIDFLGRIDDQVKVRGYRIETGEIEHCLYNYASIDEAAVAAVKHEETGDTELLACLVCHAEKPDLESLINELFQQLPAYMVPSRFVLIDQLPLTPNGKVDKRSMLEQAGEQLSMATEYIAPATETEKQLAVIWADLLDTERVGLKDHFFRQGGHSLTAMRMVSRVQHELGFEIALKEVFENPTLEALAAEMAKKAYVGYEYLEPLPEKEFYQVSHAQRRLWVLDKLDEEHIAYNMPAAFELKGSFDIPSFRKAIQAVVQRHEALRTSFLSQEGTPVQVVHAQVNSALLVHDLSQEKYPTEQAQRLIADDAVIPFDLGKPQLLRLQLIKLAEADYILVFNMHHIISDGWSTNILIEELMQCYAAFSSEQEPNLPALDIHYKEYCDWENRLLQSEQGKGLKSYWMDHLAGDLPALALPLDRPRPAIKTHKGASVTHKLNAGLVEQLKKMSLDHEASLYMTLMAVLNVLLHRHSGQKDIIIGTSTAGRQHPAFEKMIGFCVNTLPIRNAIDPESGFDQLLQGVKKTVTGAFEHQLYPFDSLVDDLETKRDMSRHAIFDVIAIVNNHEQTELSFEGIEINPIPNPNPLNKFDLGFYFDEQDDEVNIRVVHNAQLFDSGRISRMLVHFEQLCISAAALPSTAVQSLNMLPGREKSLVDSFSSTAAKALPEADLDIVSLFEQQVLATPQSIAVVCDGQKLSFEELNEHANRLANGLLSLDQINAGAVVGMSVERGMWMVIGMLGILKARCVYLPLIPDLPEARIKHILEDADCELLLIDEGIASNVDAFGVAQMEITALRHKSVTNPGIACSASDTAYIVFTSGSTGLPKGIKMAHAGLSNYLSYLHSIAGLSEDDRVLQLASINFDASFRDIMAPLTAGASISILKERDPAQMVEEIIKSQITCLLSIVPSVFEVLLTEWEEQGGSLHHLRLVTLSGERLPPTLCLKARALLGNGLQLFNLYGPSECTMTTTAYELPAELDNFFRIPAGKPIPNTEVLIMDGVMPAPVGVPGDLYIAGVGLAQGYLNNAERTQAAFVAHPFKHDEKAYKTGDRACWLPDGNVDFIGRADEQLKIRGLRVEPGEIEQQLQGLPTISRAIVLGIENEQANIELIGFIQSAKEKVDVKEVRASLQQVLPEYMIPGRLLNVNEWPLTANGKIDRKALIKLSEEDGGDEAVLVTPGNAMEQALYDIWLGILDRSELGVTDNFFAVGGHSLSAIRMAARIHKVMGIQVTLKEIFEHPTIAELAAAFAQKEQSIFEAIKKVEPASHYALSHAQRRLWILSQLEEGSTAYNILKVLKLNGKLQLDLLEQAFRELVMRHETLRTRFAVIDGEPRQIIDEESEIEFAFQDLSMGAEIEGIQALIKQEGQTPFDLGVAPLFRLRLVKIEECAYIMMLNIHHIISDGWSMTVLGNEIMALYSALVADKKPALPSLMVQYKDYAAWQSDLLSDAHIEPLRNYWFKQLGGELPVLELPYDRPRPKKKTYEGASINRVFDTGFTSDLRELAKANNSTFFMLIMAMVKALLHRYSGQTDIIVGTPVAGRRHSDLEGLIGAFVNTLAIRSSIQGTDHFYEYLREVKNAMTEAFQHEDYPFDSLVDELDLSRDLSRYPLFDVMVAMNNNDQVKLDIDSLSFEEMPDSNHTSKFDLGFFFSESEEGLNLRLEYSTDLFDHSSMAFLLQHFEQLCIAALRAPDTAIGELNLLPKGEEKLLLKTFNDTEVKYPKGHSLVSLFEEQVRKIPKNIAVVFEDTALSYEQLNKKANQLAWYLIEHHSPTADSIIPLMVSRSENMLVTLLGILKTGAAYLPIDIACPAERLKFLLEDSSAPCLLTDQDTSQFESAMPDVLVLMVSDIQHEKEANPTIQIATESLAYVIYTSGSTGMPKGVMVPHQAIVNRLQWMQEAFSIDGKEVFLQKTPYTFDVSVWELFLPVLTGAKLCMLPPDAEKDPQLISDHISTYQVSHVHFVPSMLESFLGHCEAKKGQVDLSSLKRVFASGEALAQHQVAGFKQWIGDPFNTSLINKYGPTEAAVDVSYFDCAQSDQYQTVPIGKPIANVRLHVLDSAEKLQAVGVPGELCIGGVQLARGYLNREALTNEKFIEHPLEEGGRLYKTGDLARWLPDGQIEYLGRIDDQVKIRGHRVEPGEVEHVLHQHIDVKECVVLPLVTQDKETELIAFIVTTKADLNAAELRSHLASHIPDYMVPSRYVAIDTIPITANGKVDKKTLLKERGTLLGSGTEYKEPTTPTEVKLTAIWHELLGRERIGTKDNFFELGGHSLKGTRMVAHIHREFGCNITLRQIFEYPDIEQLASEIDNQLWLQNEQEEAETNKNTYTTTL